MRKVPRWKAECTLAIKQWNEVFKTKIYTENMETSRGSKGYKDSKNLYWRKYCELLGKNTPLGRVQCTIKPKSGNSKDYYFPAIIDNDKN